MNQRYNDITKRPKLKENQPGILKIYACCWKFQQWPLVQERPLSGLPICL